MNIAAMMKHLQAYRLRRAGRYGRAMVAAAYSAWREDSSPSNLLMWCKIRRDLGLPLRSRLALMLLSSLIDLRSPKRSLAIALLLESQPWLVRKLPNAWMSAAEERCPAIGSLLKLTPSSALAFVAESQAEWRGRFIELLTKEVSTTGIAIVGNAASVRERRLGSEIDACGVVFRFNQFPADSQYHGDIGLKTTVWVVSPAYRGPLPVNPPKWVIVAGPAMEYTLANWGMVQAYLAAGIPVLTIPLFVWRRAVSRLESPPSAGMLVLFWLRAILRSAFENANVVGIGEYAEAKGRYHLASNRLFAASRHNWSGEAELIKTWGCRFNANSRGSRNH